MRFIYRRNDNTDILIVVSPDIISIRPVEPSDHLDDLIEINEGTYKSIWSPIRFIISEIKVSCICSKGENVVQIYPNQRATIRYMYKLYSSIDFMEGKEIPSSVLYDIFKEFDSL